MFISTKCPKCGFPLEGGKQCLICGYKPGEQIQEYLTLPHVDYKRLGWSMAQQLRKVGEEFGEVAEAVANNDPVQIVREGLDAMQTLDTLINIVADEYRLDLARFYREHEQKLIQKGYLKGE